MTLDLVFPALIYMFVPSPIATVSIQSAPHNFGVGDANFGHRFEYALRQTSKQIPNTSGPREVLQYSPVYRCDFVFHTLER